MSGYNEVIDTLKEIRRFLTNKLNPQLMASVQSTMDLIQARLGDPNIPVVVGELRTTLEKIDAEHLIENLSGMATEINRVIKELDPATVKDISDNLKDLLRAANKAQLVDEVSKVLHTINSVTDFIASVSELIDSNNYIVYGLTGAVMGAALAKALHAFMANKHDQKLQKSIDQLVSISAQQLTVGIQELRAIAVGIIIDFEFREQKNPNWVPSARIIKEKEYYSKVMDALEPLDPKDLKFMQEAQEYGLKLLRAMHNLETEPMVDYLNRINHNMNNAESELVDYVISAPQYRWRKLERPVFFRSPIYYNQIVRQYGEKNIQPIMSGLAKQFADNGGNNLYYSLANSYEDSAAIFSECVKAVFNVTPMDNNDAQEHQDIQENNEANVWDVHVKQLVEYYHLESQGAQQYIADEWNKIQWKYTTPELTPEILNTIRIRAYFAFCHKTSFYLCFPYNSPREIGNGLLDIPMGVAQTILHPIKSIENTLRLFTIDGISNAAKNLVTRAGNHPMRFVTTAVASSAASYGTYKCFHPTKISHQATNLSKHVHHHSSIGMFKVKIPHIPNNMPVAETNPAPTL